MVKPSDYIVFVDESGTPVTHKPDPEFPIFSLQFVLVRKDTYAAQIEPEFRRFKLKHHGSYSVVLHGRKIDNKEDEFKFLRNRALYSRYVRELDELIGASEVRLYSAFFLHLEVAKLGTLKIHPYAYFMHELLNRIENEIAIPGVRTSCEVIVESRRGSDAEMLEAYGSYKAAFRTAQVEFELVLAEKSLNITGLQIADLVAKPIARYCLNPLQPVPEWPTVSTKVEQMLNLTKNVPFRLGVSPLL
jgi:hypothetical protein